MSDRLLPSPVGLNAEFYAFLARGEVPDWFVVCSADDVGDTKTASDERWAAVDHGVPDRARLVVAAIAGKQQGAAQTAA